MSSGLCRFDTFEKMKAWMIDIKNEAHNMKPTEEETADWWAALFNDVRALSIAAVAYVLLLLPRRCAHFL